MEYYVHYELAIDKGKDGMMSIAADSNLHRLILTAKGLLKEHSEPMVIDCWRGDKQVLHFDPIWIRKPEEQK